MQALHRGDLTEAESLLAEAVQTYGLDVESRQQYALVLWRREARPEALRQLDQAIELAGDDPLLLTRRAEWQFALGHTAAGLADLEAALDIEPHCIAARFLRARHFQRFGHWELALADFHQVLALAPTHPEALLEKARVHWQLAQSTSHTGRDQLQCALATLQTLLSESPPDQHSPDALLLTGRVYGGLARYDDAAQALAAAVRRAGPNAEILYYLADSQYHCGRCDEALATVQQSLTLAPASPAAQALVARIQLARSRDPSTVH